MTTTGSAPRTRNRITTSFAAILLLTLPSIRAFSAASLRNDRAVPTGTSVFDGRSPRRTAVHSLSSRVESDLDGGVDVEGGVEKNAAGRSSDIRVEKMDVGAAGGGDEDGLFPPSISVVADRIARELEVVSESASITYRYVIRTKFKDGGDLDDGEGLPQKLVKLCDDIDDERAHLESIATNSNHHRQLTVESVQLRLSAMELARYHLLIKLLKDDYPAYIATASFLSPSRIPRLSLPNLQDVPLGSIPPSTSTPSPTDPDALVDDCTLDDVAYRESPLDRALLAVFRLLVQKNTNGISSPLPGILGLLEQGRVYMLKPGQTDTRQHDMVKETLADLMTPFLPPFYRVFMSGIVPDGVARVGGELGGYAGKQIGPWFYAPWMTTMVTPIFFGFLVGPSYPNRRKDGERGGLVVEKCKFLQESGCKGLCLNICKLPTQQFFKDELGLELTVSPNFATQECQWSFGEAPLPPEEDPSFPRGCLVGCQSRAVMAETYADTRGSCS